MSLKRDYRRIPKLNAGPGGWYCQCCNPYFCSPRRMKPKARRRARRMAKQAIELRVE